MTAVHEDGLLEIKKGRRGKKTWYVTTSPASMKAMQSPTTGTTPRQQLPATTHSKEWK